MNIIAVVLLTCILPVHGQPTLPDRNTSLCPDMHMFVEIVAQRMSGEIMLLRSEIKEELKALTDNLTADVGHMKREMVTMVTKVTHLEDREKTAANLIRETKSAITQQTKALNESVMLALGDMETRIHMVVECMNNDSNTDKYRPVNHMNTSCASIHADSPIMASGVYTIYPGGKLFARAVYCDMSTDGGGWTVIQHRNNGSLLFNRTWADYKHGFGSAYGELWIGNTALHQLTAQQSCEMRVDLWDWEGQHRYAVYSSFRVANESDNYRLTIGGYNGTAGDSLSNAHNAQQFSTSDRDNDRSPGSCVDVYGGGWWYGRCHNANLNGRYDRHGTYSGGKEDGLVWYHWRGHWYSLKDVSMMVRPRH